MNTAIMLVLTCLFVFFAGVTAEMKMHFMTGSFVVCALICFGVSICSYLDGGSNSKKNNFRYWN